MIHVFVEDLNVKTRNIVRKKYEDFHKITLTRLAEYARDMDQRSDGTRYGDEPDPIEKKRKIGGRGRGNEEREGSARTTPLLSTETEASPL